VTDADLIAGITPLAREEFFESLAEKMGQKYSVWID
jgi:hypothetical protein